MHQQWRWLSFLHWRYPVDAVQALLPERLRVEAYDGSAWVGLVPFLMAGVRAPAVPPLPWLSRFPETNVRTYVRGPDGQTGIWFFSLDAARLPAVLTGRATYGLPYCWSSMSVRWSDGELRYRARRRWPGPDGAGCHARVRFGPDRPAADLTTLDHFLTARYRLYSVVRGRLVAAVAEHPPWQLRRVEVLELQQDLLQAAGLPAPDQLPIGHASDGTRVRIGAWRAV